MAVVGGAGLLVLAGIWLTRQPANPPAWWEMIVLPLGMAAAVWWIFDGSETRRSALLNESELIVGGDMGKYSSPETFKVDKIDTAKIVMPEESKWPAPAVYFVYEGKPQAIGIDPSVSKERLAQALSDVGIAVQRDGWQPNQESEFSKIFRWEADTQTIQPTASLNDISDGEPGLVEPLGIVRAIFRQCWALTLWLVIAIAFGIYAWNNWGAMGLGQLIAVVGVPLALFVAAAHYTERIATAATSKILIRSARNQIARRSGSLVSGSDPELVPVEIFERDQFDNRGQKIYEMGFVRGQHEQGQIVFEGKKQRWSIPSNSVRKLAIEEVQIGTEGQSMFGQLNYYVTLDFKTPDGNREFGFRYSDVDYGEVTDVKRAEGGVRVFEELVSVLESRR